MRLTNSKNCVAWDDRYGIDDSLISVSWEFSQRSVLRQRLVMPTPRRPVGDEVAS